MATRQKLKEFLSSIDGLASGKNMISISTDPTDMGPADRFNEGDDLGIEPGTNQELLGMEDPSTGLLGDFVSYLTDIAQNSYKLEPGNSAAVSINSRLGNTNSGVALEASDNQGAESVFIEGSASARNTLGAVMAQYSNGYFPVEDLQKIISKDNTVPDLSGKHAQELLSNVEGGDANKYGATFSDQIPEEDSESSVPMLLSAQQVLVNRSRFNPSSNKNERKAFAPYPTSEQQFKEGDNDAGTTTSQNEFGGYDKSAVKMIYDDLRSVGASLLLKSAGMDNADSPGGSKDPNPPGGFKPPSSSPLSQNAYEARDGMSIKISPSLLRSREAYGSPSEEDGDSTRSGRGAWDTLIGHDDTISSTSFGSITTPDVKFSGQINKDVLVAHASAAIAAMIMIAEETMGLITEGVETVVSMQRGPYFKGEATALPLRAKFALLRNVALVATQNPYKQCVVKGFDVLFDSRDDGQSLVQESPVFWLSIARKIIRSCSMLNSELVESFESSLSSGMADTLSLIQDSGILKIMNVAATVGDISITMYGKTGDHTVTDPVGQWNVDRLPDGPATRISKSRSQTGLTSNALAWRGNSVPSLYMIPKNVIMASAKMGTLTFGQNPAKGMLGTSLIKNTYVDVKAEGPGARIPGDIVERMENSLDAEYVPFYFHDLRTNEIVAFHAFLEGLSDSFNPQFISTAGYGRMDPVQVYKTTSRSLTFTFFVASTSKEDFNEMWWKINKLTTLVYPQWTEGTRVSTEVDGSIDKSTFIQPFSQILGSSPIIRLRIGDVIKSNYSNFNLARIFGIGNSNISPKISISDSPVIGSLAKAGDVLISGGVEEQLSVLFQAAYASPLSLGDSSAPGNSVIRGARAAASQLLVNGFANPLGVGTIMRELQDPDARINAVPFSNTAIGAIEHAASALRGSDMAQNVVGYTALSFPYLKASKGNGYLVDEDSGLRWRITHPIRVRVLSRDTKMLESKRDGVGGIYKGPAQRGAPTQKTLYRIKVVDFNAPSKLFNKEFNVSHSDLMPNPDSLFNTYTLSTISIQGAADLIVQTLANEAATLSGIPADTLDIGITSDSAFMRNDQNPIVRSFESTSGRGLAGVITRLGYEWIDSINTWEVDWNSRAPKYAKVSISFDVIHDIPPGIDYSGYNRAPIYNVGDTMQKIAGDPYGDSGRGSHDSYKNQGRKAAQSNNAEED